MELLRLRFKDIKLGKYIRFNSDGSYKSTLTIVEFKKIDGNVYHIAWKTHNAKPLFFDEDKISSTTINVTDTTSYMCDYHTYRPSGPVKIKISQLVSI